LARRNGRTENPVIASKASRSILRSGVAHEQVARLLKALPNLSYIC
jgi:hypothetical protein